MPDLNDFYAFKSTSGSGGTGGGSGGNGSGNAGCLSSSVLGMLVIVAAVSVVLKIVGN